MRGMQEKIGLLAAVDSEYRGTQHSSEWFGGSIQKPPLFCVVQCVTLTRIAGCKR